MSCTIRNETMKSQNTECSMNSQFLNWFSLKPRWLQMRISCVLSTKCGNLPSCQACLTRPARVSCLKAADLDPSLSPRRYRDDVSIVVNPLTTRTAKQQCAWSWVCVEALGTVIIWSEVQWCSVWCSHQRPVLFCRELDQTQSVQHSLL